MVSSELTSNFDYSTFVISEEKGLISYITNEINHIDLKRGVFNKITIQIN